MLRKAYSGLTTDIGVLVAHARAAGNDFLQGTMGSWVLPAPAVLPINILVPGLVNLSTSPADPAPYQGYAVITKVSPALSNVLVQSWMYGTDGYRQSGAGYTDEGGQWSMYIPGAVPGVVDNVSTPAFGQTRNTFIVF